MGLAMFTGRGEVGVKELERSLSESLSSSACRGVRSRVAVRRVKRVRFINL